MEIVKSRPRDINREARVRRAAVNVLLYTVMVLIAVVLIFPYFFMVMKSLMSEVEVIGPVRLFPSVPQFVNYVTLFEEGGYFTGTLNSLAVVAFNLVAVPLSASVIAFSFAKLQWVGRNVMFAIMLGTLMLPAAATQTALYIMYSDFGWTDTLLPFTVPNLFGGGAINIFLLRQFMLGIPRDMDNAAKIDGSSTFRRYWSITLPLCKPVLIYIMVTTFIAYWGDFYGPLLYMSSSEAPRTLAYVIYLDSTEGIAASYKANIRMAGGVFMTIIPAILFAVFQKQLIEGVVMTGIKG